ncbi:MAG TPA: AAA family ATPase, partial [Chitinophagaceae bacterium]
MKNSETGELPPCEYQPMSHFDSANTIFQKAVAFVTQTNSHLFLTGKAGTGKTTFLKYIRDNCSKKTAIVAPTGVAAINAGGVTIHSFFQLPMGTYLPTAESRFDTFDGAINNQHTLFKNLKLSGPKKELLQELDLLIIDEISMVRADTLDAIDAVLRNVRKQPLMPFGGVQMLYIGDLFQLPPVVKQDEWKYLQEYYKSPFFFDAEVVRQAPPVYIELKKIYRQSDDAFISILNNIRNNRCTQDDLEHLHQYYQPNFIAQEEDNYITLTSHNEKADAINRSELNKLKDKLHTFRAHISGEFSERSFPAEEELHLKEGAQIMFIKNDKGENRRYFNGKIGVIASISEDDIMISFPGETELLRLETEKWQNIRYRYNKEKDRFEEEELGTFTQFPIRLAWAITIHKSQGLTFDKAIIDAGASFAAGQVYVALSRLTGLGGLVLRSRINPESIRTDERVVQFVKNELSDHRLQETLEAEQQAFIKSTLLKKFAWEKIRSAAEQILDEYDQRKLLNKNVCLAWAGALYRSARDQNEVAQKFLKQLEYLLINSDKDGHEKLHLRMEAAARYFIKEIDENLLNPLIKHIEEVRAWPKIKKYLTELHELRELFRRQKVQVHQALEITRAMYESAEISLLLKLAEGGTGAVVTDEKPEGNATDILPAKKGRTPKGETNRITLKLFRAGKTIAEIAAERSLAASTIETHLASFVPTGEIDV